MDKKKVLVAMSGGVDSSVSAYLLKKEGYDVAGITMILGSKTNKSSCGLNPIEDAKMVCDRLGIPHYVIDFTKDLEDKVISKFIGEYLNGRTPNPCIDCNRFLKFELLLDKANELGFDFLATGHYAKIERIENEFFLKRAEDKKKDQSYFLYAINKEKLSSIIFPLANLTKERVFQIAKELNLGLISKPQSQDICFIQGDYRKFLISRHIDIKGGDIVDTKENLLGKHKGIFFYTIGQREKLGISYSQPLYVLSIDKELNRIIVGEKDELFAKGLIAEEINLLVKKIPNQAYAKIRYQHKEARCKVYLEGGKIKVFFEEKQSAITPGQSLVLYDKDLVLGGGMIKEIIW
ncbi:MAG: tRNA 2-thiouridine(34) synthase MnmA [Candidatus Omnitrophica bacterium]|nr:tRNA 2-thiouridine(34) synthase MnmA [Candidatus Omnitrophota bacterium]MCM8823608.1 tRNA 2-thiouridine(34) synthase MnmA [Candidatus Omnitrophota bacterium]MCM8827097.1 tRNA 2-thiouridine(34) synthase MnmA [Candidatus Omnitrophota bacterium]